MAFDPLYAAGPGRPSVRRFVDPSIVGQQLQAIPDGMAYGTQVEPPKAPGMSGGMYQPTTQDRITGAVSAFGANTDPTSVYAPEQFLGSAARGFAGVKTYLNNLQQQHAASQRQREQDELNRRNIESQIRDRETLGQVNAPRIGQADWRNDPTTPGQDILGYTHPQTGEFVPQTYQGKPFVRPTPSPQRRIDPNSEEGIAQRVEAAGRIAREQMRVNPPATVAAARAFATRASNAMPRIASLQPPSNFEYEVGIASPFKAGQSEAFRLWRTNALQFIYPILRKETGAAISDKEFRDAVEMYIPEPGDGPAVLAAKRLNREEAVRSLETMGNQSGEEPPPGYVPLQ